MLIDNELYYYDTEGEDFETLGKEIFYNDIGIPGVPSMLYVKYGNLQKGLIGGAPSAKEVYNYLYSVDETESSETESSETSSSETEPIKTESNETSSDVNKNKRLPNTGEDNFYPKNILGILFLLIFINKKNT